MVRLWPPSYPCNVVIVLRPGRAGGYVALASWTDQGAKNVKDTIKRADAFIDAATKMGCKVREILYTMGPHDVVTIIDAPNDETASKLTLAVGMQGSIRTLSMRAYTKDEMAKIVAGLP